MFALCIESSHARGLGHLYRAMNLADVLRERGHAVQFLLNEHDVSLRLLAQWGHKAMVVDLLDDQSGWEAEVAHKFGVTLWANDRLNTGLIHAGRVKHLGLPLVTFDDRGEGAALADLHIAALAFDGAPLQGREVLKGATYLVLNTEIAAYQRLREHAGSILVTLGGSDTHGVTIKVLSQLKARGLSATVILGPGFAHHHALKAISSPTFKVLDGVPSMIKEMSHHELAITGGGITPFEANAAGLPCIVVANETFEVPVGLELARLGGSVFAGHHSNFTLPELSHGFPIRTMSQAGISQIGLGGTARVVQAMEDLLP